MRSEKEMMHLILGTAKKDERIRAVYMNGSRTNTTVTTDIFQDYDIVYVVTDTTPFIQDKTWINRFGELLIHQEPDKNDFCPENLGAPQTYGYLMLFKDGNRIDLHVETKEHMKENYLKDKLTVPLLDKDDCLPDIPPPTDEDYHVKEPTEAEYLASCNEFWWCQQNVAKALWRDELPYAKYMMECVIRKQLDKMTEWWIGIDTDFSVSTGKTGNYFKRLLPVSYWEQYKATYTDGEHENVWHSLFVMGELFRTLARVVGGHFSYTYPEHEDRNMTAYLKQVESLPGNAERIFDDECS
ncbi:aminoglycoside 6-adenylyltransferase [Salimicrobium flavidum]|uniref:Aminoglycoside 6-adenylyltransferase n=1 Tax=Salimicrobium flavidum TaxID=570947 RepID=A0A1N7JAH3_9BACI|nr:aminoglycoside 6-adenylyltransferase [Salimicrobium flavidum]SIS46325.1 aminoglycoside 6-adenylyltransferase [Salimicrobium flavidum]